MGKRLSELRKRLKTLKEKAKEAEWKLKKAKLKGELYYWKAQSVAIQTRRKIRKVQKELAKHQPPSDLLGLGELQERKTKRAQTSSVADLLGFGEVERKRKKRRKNNVS